MVFLWQRLRQNGTVMTSLCVQQETWFSARSFPELKGGVMIEGNFGKLIVSNYVVIFIAASNTLCTIIF